MTSQFRRNGCDGKVRHTSRSAAKAALNKLVKGGAYGPALHAYKCANCGAYHVGHWTKPPRA